MVARKMGVSADKICRVIIWGNHSSTQYPDVNHATIGGKPVREVVGDDAYLDGEFVKTVQQRGAAIIEARGASSAASAANAAIDHMHDWALGSDTVVSMGVYSDGSYGVAEGLIYSFPVTCQGGDWSIVQGVEVNAFSQEKMDATETELTEERAEVAHLLPWPPPARRLQEDDRPC